MEIIGIERRIEAEGATAVLRYTARKLEEAELESGEDAGAALVFDSLGFDELLDLAEADDLRPAFADRERLAIQPGGWQSWSAGWELVGRESLPRRVRVVSELIKFTNRDGDEHGRREIVGHFLMYLRAGDDYLCLASRDGGALPPVTWRIDRKAGRVTMEAYAPPAAFADGDEVAEVRVFRARGFFGLKDELRRIYGAERFGRLGFLFGGAGRRGAAGLPAAGSGAAGTGVIGSGACAYGKDSVPGGFESWYNHYTDIDERLILDDLEALDRTENLIARRYVRRGRPVVFQIDDGWQRAVGEWEIEERRFPGGLATIAERIEAKGWIPGLWLAPFLVTRKARVFREKSEWLLRERSGEPVVAGFNDRWDHRFYCLDISRPDVLDYLSGVIDRAIDEWGFRYLKLDFMYAGLLSGAWAGGAAGQAAGANAEPAADRRSAADGRKAAYRFYEEACRRLTARTADQRGRPVAYLGCGVPFGPSYPHFPLSRIGADTRETWDWPKVRLIGHVGRPSAYISLMDTIGRSYMDGTVFVNDPDVVFLRERNCSLAANEKELIALVDFLLASQVMFSDDPVRLSPEEAALTERIARLYEELADQGPAAGVPADEEYGAVRVARDVFRLESRSLRIAGLINLRGRPFDLKRGTDERLFAALTSGVPLVDHRIKKTERSVRFAPRSITIVRL